MFSSLDRADIVLNPDPDGRQKYVQTDHRTCEEIEQCPEISTLFALIRILNPKRMAEIGSPDPVVLYSAQVRPPEFLRRVIHAAGGQLVIGDTFQPESNEAEPASLIEIVEVAFVQLVRAVRTEYGLSLSADGLESLEKALAQKAIDPEAEEFEYWSAVLKLGSFAGEVIRESNGGRWIITKSGSLPFSLSTRFRGEEATVNPLGKAIKRFTNGDEDSLVTLIHLIRSQS